MVEASPAPAAALLFGQFGVALVAVAAVSWWAVRRFSVPAVVWLAGALTFVASQALRIPLLSGADLLGAGALVLVVGAVVTSGLFEEGARFVALRWAVKRARRADDAIVFGLGHGGMEAILLLGIGAVGGAVLLWAGDAALEAARAGGAEAVTAVEAQLAALRDLTALDVAVGLYERVLAVVTHVAMTLLVLRAVVARNAVWLVAAAGFHMLVNGVVLVVAEEAGIVAAEAAMTAFAVAAAFLIRVAWRRRADWYLADTVATDSEGSLSTGDRKPS